MHALGCVNAKGCSHAQICEYTQERLDKVLDSHVWLISGFHRKEVQAKAEKHASKCMQHTSVKSGKCIESGN
jgi:metal-dependent hydrolase (beta-lactamase superfamily II)